MPNKKEGILDVLIRKFSERTIKPVKEFGGALGKRYETKQKDKQTMLDQMKEMIDPKRSRFAKMMSEKFKKR